MAFVQDGNDPSGLGMFSKPGRFTSEKYIIFQKKDEILGGQKKKYVVSSLPSLSMKKNAEEQAKIEKSKDFTEEEKPKKMVSPKLGKTAGEQPFAKVLSREDIEHAKLNKSPPPPFGFYKPKFRLVEKKTLTLFDYNREKKEEYQSGLMKSVYDPNEASKPIPDKLKKKVLGPIPLDLYLERDYCNKPKTVPHEKRFQYVPIPKTSTKYRKVNTIIMNSTLGREKGQFFKSLEYAPDYNPNFEYGKRGLGSCGPTFDKYSPRKPFNKTLSTLNEDYVDYEKLYHTQRSNFFPIVTSPTFSKMLSRGNSASSVLPTFMQKTLNNRFSLDLLNEKTLETNNFSDGRFMTLTTSFSPNKMKSLSNTSKSKFFQNYKNGIME